MINGMPRWLYRLRFIIQIVRMCWPSPEISFREAWDAGVDEFDSGGDEQHEGYSPEDSAREAVSYWEPDGGGP